MRYYVYLEDEPTLDCYRLHHEPRTGLAPVFICPFVVLTDEEGGMYNAMRGIQGESKGTTMNYGIYKLDGKLDQQLKMYVPFSELPVKEPYWVEESPGTVSIASEYFKLDFSPRSFGWKDASGRLDLKAELLGQVCTFWIPEQEGYDHPQMLRSHLGKAEGTLDGRKVEGLFMLDYIYSRPESMWKEMGMLTHLHNLWMNWLVEYEDGSLEGGYAWRGRPGNGFAAAHHYADGISKARSDARLTTETTERGTIKTVTLELGDSVKVELEQLGSLDWPLHTCGVVKSVSGRPPVKKSWNYTEYFPVNWPQVADFQAAYEGLYGKPVSFRRLMQKGRIDENEMLVFDEYPI